MTSYTHQAVERAVGAGYLEGKLRMVNDLGWVYPVSTTGVALMPISEMLIDPAFWQALGKAEGWNRIFSMASYGTTGDTNIEGASVGSYEYDGISEDDHSLPARPFAEWEYRWHSFIDHLIAGQDIESFFAELLTK